MESAMGENAQKSAEASKNTNIAAGMLNLWRGEEGEIRALQTRKLPRHACRMATKCDIIWFTYLRANGEYRRNKTEACRRSVYRAV